MIRFSKVHFTELVNQDDNEVQSFEGIYNQFTLRVLFSPRDRVSDLPLLGRTTLEETRSLMSLLYSTFGYRRLAVAGRSMGGLHAAMISGLLRFPVGMVAWMSPPSAVPAFISGILSASCAWESLSSDEKYAAVRDMVDERSTQTDPKAMLRDILSITDIRNFPVPIKPEAGIVAVAKHDEYLGQIINEWQVCMHVVVG